MNITLTGEQINALLRALDIAAIERPRAGQPNDPEANYAPVWEQLQLELQNEIGVNW